MTPATPTTTFRVVVADDHPVVRIGVRNILVAVPEFQIVGECSDGEAALKLAVDRLDGHLKRPETVDSVHAVPGFGALNDPRTLAALFDLGLAALAQAHGTRGYPLGSEPAQWKLFELAISSASMFSARA